MAGVSAEQVALAKQVDLLSYLQASEPHELLRSKSPGEYRTATHGSLVISKGLWFWNRGGFGGRSAIDFLINVLFSKGCQWNTPKNPGSKPFCGTKWTASIIRKYMVTHSTGCHCLYIAN